MFVVEDASVEFELLARNIVILDDNVTGASKSVVSKIAISFDLLVLRIAANSQVVIAEHAKGVCKSGQVLQVKLTED